MESVYSNQLAAALLSLGFTLWLFPMGIYQWRTAERTAKARQETYEEEGDPLFGTLIAGFPWYRSVRGIRVYAASYLAFAIFGCATAVLYLSGVLAAPAWGS